LIHRQSQKNWGDDGERDDEIEELDHMNQSLLRLADDEATTAAFDRSNDCSSDFVEEPEKQGSDCEWVGIVKLR